VRYCLTVANGGPLPATNMVASDPLPSGLSYVAGSLRSGANCSTAATIEDDDNVGADENDPVGASFSGGIVIIAAANMANGATLAVTFDATIN
jgi:uncharacterized repeat protein (TIGR01451 family)